MFRGASMIRTILHYPDERLRNVADPVTEVTDEIRALVDDMAETMYAAPGCGLAATQIGVKARVFVIDTATEDEPSALRVFVNPEIVASSGKTKTNEGCLSFPEIDADIERAERVTVRAKGRDGEEFSLEASGFLAIAIQHELDHLNGVLMIDHMGILKKRMTHRKMLKRKADRAAAVAD